MARGASENRCGLRVLIVDDEVLVASYMEDLLQDAGWDTVTALEPVAAVAALKDPTAPTCALVTDIDLGGAMNGYDLARRTRETSPHMPVVYVSGGSPGRWSVEGVPMSKMLTKPFSADDLVSALERLGVKRPPSP